MELNIFEINQKLADKDYELQTAKEKLLNKENSLWLDTDWDNLKKEKGITTEAKRKAHVQTCTQTLRQRVTLLRLERDNFKRIYTALLWDSRPTVLDVVTGQGK
jgi:hypothetical protein